MKRLNFTLAFLASLLVIVALLFTSLQICMNDAGWYERQYENMNLSARIGISTGDITKALMRLVDYMEGRVDSIQLTVTEDGKQVEMYNERETQHMLDVRELYQAWRSVRDFGVLAAAVLLLAALYVTGKGERLRLVSRAFLWASAAFGALLAALGAFALADFDAFWIAFHHLFFDNDLWLLSYQTDRMIRICPEELFSGIIARFALLFLIPLAALLAAALFGRKPHAAKAARVGR
ncbi:MAG TPA: TIGR01906 family membrane protein [Clostridia bacterium]|nr:TIGR01906 family membrane protein [Clostridia bacterium]